MIRIAGLATMVMVVLVGCAGGGGGGGGGQRPDRNDNTNTNTNDNANGNPDLNDNAGANDNAGSNDNIGGGIDGGSPFGSISGTEIMVEGSRSEQPNGDSRRRDERFTAAWTLMPTSAFESAIFVGDVLTTRISGDIAGQAELTYEESGTDITVELECPTTTYAGNVAWSISVEGSYSYVPLLGTITLTTHATNVSSTEYTVAFTTPGCPDQDSQNPANYAWSGPGQGVWGFVDIVLENGHYENHLDNPLADDLGAQDYYQIEANVGG